MRFLRNLFLLCIAVIGGTVSAQSQRELGQLMRERGEYYFTLSVDSPKEIQTVSEICSVDGTDGRTVVAYANQQEYEKLLREGYQPNLQTPPSLREEAKMWDGNRATYEWDSYPTYSQYQSMMQAFPASAVSGRTCTYIELGTLSSGRKIMGVRINNGSPEGKPKFLYSSTIHGDETTGWILMLRLIDELCTSTDSRIVNLVNDLDIFIFPNTNPDGTYYGGNNTVTGARRANANGIDMNRNYADPHGSAHPDGNAYQTETQWFMQLAEDYPFVMAANFHGGAEVVNYPWDNTYTRHADDAWWQYVSREYANLAHAVSSNYMTDENNGITNGADWYTIGGGRQDYMNGYCQCREITIECSTTKNPSATQLPSFWNYNHNAMLTYMEECLNGVHGFVYDANTNQPIDGVTVTVQDHDDEYSIVSTHEAGDFHRPIKGGTYTIGFEKEGYCPQFIDVTVADGQRVELNNIQLTPGNCMVPNFSASTTNVSLGQSISFTDASYGDIVSWSWTFEGATPSTSTAQNPTGITYSTAGDYDVTLIITDSEGNSDTLTKSDYIHVAETITMQDGTVTTCSGIFYDSGGPDANYGNSLTYTMTFYPETEGAMVSVAFTQFDTESNYDYLYIYDGTSTSATQIGQYSGTNSPGTVTANNSEGTLTFKFTSDQSVNKTGWAATVSCMTFERTITAAANPAAGGTVEGAGSYTSGATCTLTATAAENYRFIHWTENGEVVSTDSIYSFQVTVDRDLVAVFGSTIPVNITVSASPARGGSVSGGGEFLCGETCTVMATPNEGYTFINWSEDGTLVSEDMEYSFMVTDGRDLVANFSHMTVIEVGQSETTSNFLPSYSYYMQALTQQIYTAEEIGTAGTIISIAFYNEGTTRTRNYDFYLKTTNKSSFSSKTDWITVAASDKVFSGTVTMTADTWTTIVFDTPFEYDGTSNLVLVADDNTGRYDSSPYMSCSVFTTSTNQAIYYWDDNINFDPLSPPTSAGSSGWSGNPNDVLSMKNHIRMGIEMDEEVEQTVTFGQGINWWSTNLDITLDQLKDAIAGALGSAGTATIKSKTRSMSYENGQWRPTSIPFDIREMYKIQVSAACQITLAGMPVNPATYEITIGYGSNWIGFLSGKSMSIDEAFAGLNPVEGDAVKSKTQSASYDGTIWRGQLKTLEPGKGYIYQSKAIENKTFTYPTSN